MQTSKSPRRSRHIGIICILSNGISI